MIAPDRLTLPSATAPAEAPADPIAESPATAESPADAATRALPGLAAIDPIPAPGTSWMLRRIRRVVRCRLRVELAALALAPALVSDGDLRVVLTPRSAGNRRVVAWRADRAVELVVIRDGCGARVLGPGGHEGRIELPASACPDAYVAFCYDLDRLPASDPRPSAGITRP
jgi:hypothetical protein